MKVIQTSIQGLFIIEPTLFHDDRGFFYESFNERAFNDQIGLDVNFVQDNHSHSKQGVLRGLHYQLQQSQGKLIRVVQGTIFDVAVDLRRDSSTFGQWQGVELSEKNCRQLFIPPGFAHGFLTLSPSVDVLYKTTDYYAPKYERTILWNDPTINIQWPVVDGIKLSEKDRLGLSFVEAIKEENF